MTLIDEVAEVMRSRGFKLERIASSSWFTRSRQEQWTDAFYLELHSGSRRLSLSFGIENATVRSLALRAAAEISPLAHSQIAAPPYIVLAQPSVNIFLASMEDPIVHFDYARVDETLIDFIETKFFEPVDSNVRYLDFLKNSTGVFDWRRSAAVFRLIYIGYLYHLEGITSAEFAKFCESIPKRTLEGHILLRKDARTAEAFVEACIKKIWC